MLESIFTSKDVECPCCGAQGMTVMLRGSETFVVLDDRFRREIRNGEADVVCVNCDALADPVIRSGYN